MKQSQNYVIYQSNSHIRQGFFSFWKMLFNDICISLPLGWRLFLRDFKSIYAQQIFGVLWVIIQPVINVIIFVLLKNAAVFTIEGIQIPYVVYAFLGITFWSIISNLVVDSTTVINASSSFITQINFPKQALLVSPFLISAINLFIRLFIFIIICILYSHYLPVVNYLYLFTLIPAFLFAFSLGAILSIAGAVLKDISLILGLLFQVLFFITPVMYGKPSVSILATLTNYNPFYYLVVVPRDLILYGNSTELNGFFICAGIALILFFLSMRFFKIAVYRVIEKI